MKELNAFRQFMEGKGSTVKLSKSDMDKLHKDKEIEVDGHTIQFGEGEENVSENTTMPDIDILGKKFNFSDICPGAHKAIANLAKEYANNDVMLGDLLYLANLHQTFFNLEKKALGPQGIDADDLNNIKELYVDINNIANNAFGEEVGKEVKTYMNMHMGKIKKAGLKASEPGGSSDTSYAQDWADEQDAMYGKANFVEGEDEDWYMDETGDEDEFVKEEDLSENDKALDEILEEGKVKDFLLKILLKTTDVVSPDTLKYVYSELVKQVGEDEANETFQELGLDPNKYKE